MSRDVEMFTAAALSGLCALPHHRTDSPEAIAARALAIGKSTAEALGAEHEPGENPGAVMVHFHAAEIGDLDPGQIRELVRAHLEDVATRPGA